MTKHIKGRRVLLFAAILICALALAACGTTQTKQTAKTTKKATTQTSGEVGNYQNSVLYQSVFMQFQGAVAENQSASEVKEDLAVIDGITVGEVEKKTDKTAELTVTQADNADLTLTFTFTMDGDAPADSDACTGIRFAHGNNAVSVTNKNGSPTYYIVTDGSRKKADAIDDLTAAVTDWQK